MVWASIGPNSTNFSLDLAIFGADSAHFGARSTVSRQASAILGGGLGHAWGSSNQMRGASTNMWVGGSTIVWAWSASFGANPNPLEHPSDASPPPYALTPNNPRGLAQRKQSRRTLLAAPMSAQSLPPKGCVWPWPGYAEDSAQSAWRAATDLMPMAWASRNFPWGWICKDIKTHMVKSGATRGLC